MSVLDVNQLVADIKTAATGVLKKDVTELRGYSEDRLEAMAKQAKFIAEGIASGDITDNTREFFLESLEDDIKNFANTLRGLVLVTIEKVWNAIVEVVWGAIGKAAGAIIPV